jgi:hypothetical protein
MARWPPVTGEEVDRDGCPDKRSYSVLGAGRDVLADWLRAPVHREVVRHEPAVKIRGAAFTDAAGRTALVAEVERYRATREATLVRYLTGERRDFPDPAAHDDQQRLQHVVLRGAITYEQAVLPRLDDVLDTLRGFGR